MLRSTFEWSYGVLPHFVVPVKHKFKKNIVEREQMQDKNTASCGI